MHHDEGVASRGLTAAVVMTQVSHVRRCTCTRVSLACSRLDSWPSLTVVELGRSLLTMGIY